jgi:oligopeptide/dipeptide ABC transporter ATP-binding protein
MEPLIKIDSLKIHFDGPDGILKAVNNVDLHLMPGEILALVGESGCGKSITTLSILKLLPPEAQVISGRIRFKNQLVSNFSERQMNKIRGKEISLIQQDPGAALNPVLKVGTQITEVLRTHFQLSRSSAKKQALEWIDQVRLPNAKQIFNAYPHQLSGGMKQRVLIAIALACQPSLIIADEPTTALDVSIQFQILELLKSLVKKHGISMLLISHDLGIVAETAQRIAVMYSGRIIEVAFVKHLFTNPVHPYTQGLLQAIPKITFVPSLSSQFKPLNGTVPNPRKLPSGCAFHPRCAFADQKCIKEIPPSSNIYHYGQVACHYLKRTGLQFSNTE